MLSSDLESRPTLQEALTSLKQKHAFNVKVAKFNQPSPPGSFPDYSPQARNPEPAAGVPMGRQRELLTSFKHSQAGKHAGAKEPGPPAPTSAGKKLKG
jgi:hypothetical protein